MYVYIYNNSLQFPKHLNLNFLAGGFNPETCGLLVSSPRSQALSHNLRVLLRKTRSCHTVAEGFISQQWLRLVGGFPLHGKDGRKLKLGILI
jgi:hypothetical protein